MHGAWARGLRPKERANLTSARGVQVILTRPKVISESPKDTSLHPYGNGVLCSSKWISGPLEIHSRHLQMHSERDDLAFSRVKFSFTEPCLHRVSSAGNFSSTSAQGVLTLSFNPSLRPSCHHLGDPSYASMKMGIYSNLPVAS